MEIKLKQVGQNLILTIGDSEPKTKKVEDKETREEIKALVKDLQTKPNKAKQAKLEKIFSANEVKAKKEKETKEVAAKAVQKKITKESKKAKIADVVEDVTKIVGAKSISEDKIKDLQAENERLKKELEAKNVKTQPTSSPRRGESSSRY